MAPQAPADTTPNTAIMLTPPSSDVAAQGDAALATAESTGEAGGGAGKSGTGIIVPRGARGVSVGGKVPWYRSGVMSLTLVLGAILGIALIIKRLVPSAMGSGGEVLNCLCRTHLSSKQSVALMKMGKRLVFVGITPERITLLRTVEIGDEAADLLAQMRPGSLRRKGNDFEALLGAHTGPMTGDIEPSVTPETDRAERVARARGDIKSVLTRLAGLRNEPRTSVRGSSWRMVRPGGT